MIKSSGEKLQSAIILIFAAIVIILSLPSDVRVAGAGIFLLVGIGITAWLWLGQQMNITLPIIPTPIAYFFEIGVVSACVYLALAKIHTASAYWQLQGLELSYLVNSAAIAGDFLRDMRTIPLWNPLIGYGEPLLENPFSFVFNPFMSVPIMLFGNIQGVKIAVVLHAILAGLGGWFLGQAMGFRWHSRILLGLFLGGNGSISGALSGGFYQMALTQAYIPWVVGGVIGILYQANKRCYAAVLVTFSVMMLFGGTFWYVLPMMIAAFVITVLALLPMAQPQQLLQILKHILIATVLTIGIAMVRMLPQLVHFAYIDHPLTRIHDMGFNPLDIALRMVTRANDDFNLRYHYVLPPLFGGLVLVSLTTLFLHTKPLPDMRKRFVVLGASLILIAMFILWAQEGGLFNRWLYDTFDLVKEWRFPERMLAAATPFLALIVMMGFDTLLSTLNQQRKLLARVAIVFMLIAASLSAINVLYNWDHIIKLKRSDSPLDATIGTLREQYPATMLMVNTGNFFDYFPLYANRTRATYGNPDYQAGSLPPTIGGANNYRLAPPYAMSFWMDDQLKFEDAGYEAVTKPDERIGIWVLFTNTPGTDADALPYAFIAPQRTLQAVPDRPRIDQVKPVSYVHHIDAIDVRVGGPIENEVIVVQETAYPGWQVTVNGEPAPLESVGGYIAVWIPQSHVPIEVQFTYQPRLMAIGAIITGFSVLAFVVYALRLDVVIGALLRRI